MQLTGVFTALGENTFQELIKRISISRLRTYRIFEQIKVRTHLNKLNGESLRKAAPRLWARLGAGDSDLAADLSQAILISHLDMIIAVLDLLGIPHQDGFFSKDAEIAKLLTDGWQQRAFEALSAAHPPAVLVFYLNHLAVECSVPAELFQPALN